MFGTSTIVFFPSQRTKLANEIHKRSFLKIWPPAWPYIGKVGDRVGVVEKWHFKKEPNCSKRSGLLQVFQDKSPS